VVGSAAAGQPASSAREPVPEPGRDPGRYAAATEALRLTAKWLLAALAGVGAVLVAGLQLARLGSLAGGERPRLAVAVIAAAVALGAVAYMIAVTSRIFTDEWVTLAALDDETFQAQLDTDARARRRLALLQRLRAEIDNDRQALFGQVAGTVPALHRALREANEAARAAPAASRGQALRWAGYVQAVAGQVVDCANYHRTRLTMRRLRPRLGLAATLAAAAVLTFAYAANPPRPPADPVTVQVVSPAQTVPPVRAP
jgi:hypothetical protein